MQVLSGLDDLESPPRSTILTIGNFDGVHRGHQKIFARVVEEAQRIEGTAALITFHPHPAKLLRPETAPRLLTTSAQKLAMFDSAGLDLVVVLPFTLELCRTTAADFVQRIVVPRFHPRTILIGTPFRFGHKREGDVPLLVALGEELGFRAEGVGVVDEDGEVISSTRIRGALLGGRVAEAGRMLGRPFEMIGTVVRGAQRGKRIDVPTANLEVQNELVPAGGVYATRLQTEGKLLDSVTNIGTRPTFGDTDRVIETHVLDFQEDLYGREVGLQFVDRLREERRFPSPEGLVAQIRADIARAREILGGTSPGG